MPRLIFKCPYIKGGTSSATAHLENYVKYMATRNGVERIDPGRSEWPATSKQKKMVEQILRDFPLSRGMFEYEDYAAEPTRTNASEFITRALEDNYNQIAKKDNYLKYIATRPRAQRVGSHGLFTGEEDQLVLAQVAEAVAAHPGNVWLPIISLRREDAARLGYDKAEEWKALLSKYAMEMAEAMKIPWEDFRWYAAFHDEAHHPHIHMVCYSADPSKGFLTTQGIAQIKSGLAKEIFRQELTELYQKQTQSRDTLNEDARSVLEQLIERMWSGAVVNHRMEKLMEHLAERLRHTGGRKQYGYLKAPLKAVVDEIVDELAKEPCVAAAYALWYELREDVLRTYKDDLPPRLPLSQQKEFKRIKNIVIEEAVTLGARQQVFHPDDQQDRVPVEDQEEAPLPEAPQPDNDWNDFSESPPDDVPDKTVSAPAKAQMNWSDEYRLARRCLFGGKDQPQDLEQAFTLFQQEAQKGNALAMHDLGRMLADGLGRKIDMQAAHVWYRKALAAFHAVEEQKKNRYAEYRIGKLYAAGLGCEQDYGDAARWFQLSADKGYKYAQYSLAGLFRRGQGVEQDDARALELYTASAQQDFPYKPIRRSSLADAFRSATGDIYHRLVVKDAGVPQIINVYCRDNRGPKGIISRELVKETLHEDTNEYKKLANISLDRGSGVFSYDNLEADPNVDALSCCQDAQELFALYQTCASRRQIDTLLQNYLDTMQAVKAARGRIYFIPRDYMPKLALFEDFIALLEQHNQHKYADRLPLDANSMFVVDDEKQRSKMALAFYRTIQKDLAEYEKRATHLIQSGNQSPAIMDRMVLSIRELERKKIYYESILKQELHEVDEQYTSLRYLSDELQIRARSIQAQKRLAA